MSFFSSLSISLSVKQFPDPPPDRHTHTTTPGLFALSLEGHQELVWVPVMFAQ